MFDCVRYPLAVGVLEVPTLSVSLCVSLCLSVCLSLSLSLFILHAFYESLEGLNVV